MSLTYLKYIEGNIDSYAKEIVSKSRMIMSATMEDSGDAIDTPKVYL